jgi:hypothetical protein
MKKLIIIIAVGLFAQSCNKEEVGRCGIVTKSYLKFNKDMTSSSSYAEVDFNGEIRVFKTDGARLKEGTKYCIE